MSVMIVTSLGDIVVDLLTDRCPLTTKNFLKLCKMKYYNGCLFHKVEKDFMAQTGDPTGTGTGGDSVFKFLYGEQARFFDDEIHPDIKHSKIGTVAMASAGENCNASQFYFTLRDELDYLDGKHTVFGTVEEKDGLDTLLKINEAFVDDKARPFKDVRIKHTYILDDPFDDPPQIAEFIPEKSPEGKPHDETAQERLEDNWVPMEETLTAAELEEVIRTKEAHTNAAILESIGDIPDADIKPPENVLFVCKLNPVTQDEDLHTIFSRFGNVISADIIRDYKTGDSLCYAFVEFETNDACERAYFKMDNTLIDDRRIHVDFSQSVSKLWKQFRHGKRSQTNAGGCFKCGALNHIARDCDDDPNNKQRGTKFVMKNENNQYGENGHQRYDMLFDEDDLERQGTNVRKEVHEKQEDSKYRDYDKKHADKFRSGDDRSGGSRKEEKNQESRRVDEYRREKSRGGSREEERNRESRSVDEYRREKSRGQERYDGHEQKKHHERSSSRHWRDDRDHSRSSGGGQHEREHRKRSMDHLIRQDDGQNKMRSRNRDP